MITTTTTATTITTADDKFKIVTSGIKNYRINILNRLQAKSKENASTIIDYLFSMHDEINPSAGYKTAQIIVLSQLSEACNNQKPFLQMTRDDILAYLNNCRKSEEIDPLHKWIGTYNTRRVYMLRFFKWLYNPSIEPGKRPTPKHVIGNIAQFKRKEKSIYKPSDLWTEEDDALFLKYCPNKRDKCYHTMSRDLSARPHEILNLKIKDVIFKTNGTQQYAEVLINGKTGTRHIPLFYSVPYIKDWLDSHLQKGNKNTYLIPSLDRCSRRFGNKLQAQSLNIIYRNYKLHFFPSLLKDPKVSNEDNEKISSLLQKPWNPYVRRHSSLTEKSRILKFHTFHQHASWTPGSNMHLKYTHYFGNESSEELLESYGVETNNDKKDKDALLRPKQCPNCNESNISDAKFCAKCRMVLTYDAFSETLESEKQKDDKITALEKKIGELQNLTAFKTSKLDEFSEKLALLEKKLGWPPFEKDINNNNSSSDSNNTNTITTNTITQTAAATTEVITTPSIDSSDLDQAVDNQQQQQQKLNQKCMQKRLIKAAGRAAFLATMKRRKGRRGSNSFREK